MYKSLSESLSNQILNEKKTGSFIDYSCKDSSAIRRKNNPHDYASALRSNFIRDIDKIMNCPFFSRYADKTQVFSFSKNDDISRRSLHVQFVSRIARTIGKALNLNLELIEAIALGHDIGHTPFGHSGEAVLNELYFKNTGRRFYHNLHSVRVLDKIFPLNVSLQTLDGILCHDGEFELETYEPSPLNNFYDFDLRLENCYLKSGYIKSLTPSTLEGCVVRISDIIAYIGKDRQDAITEGVASEYEFFDFGIGKFNAEMINNLMVNIIENSYNKPYIKMDKDCFAALKKAKKDNYELIYLDEKAKASVDKMLKPSMTVLYNKLLEDLLNDNKSSTIFTHHINYVNKTRYKRIIPYETTEPNQIVADYIASMTDDYYIDLFNHLFPENDYKMTYKGYFE